MSTEPKRYLVADIIDAHCFPSDREMIEADDPALAIQKRKADMLDKLERIGFANLYVQLFVSHSGGAYLNILKTIGDDNPTERAPDLLTCIESIPIKEG